MRYRLRTLLVLLAVARHRFTRWLLRRRWWTFSLRGMFAVVTLLGIWLGFQVNWWRQRQEARRWIEEHEVEGGWSHVDPRDVWVTDRTGTRCRDRPAEAPWSLRLLGEPRLAYIHLDKCKLSEADIPRLDSLARLFPEASGVHVQEPGFNSVWPPPDRRAFLKSQGPVP
ncbi:MAG TPA: hypothetical protein VFB96_09085 [Pirellulaceae bacterium]|nr:hypothetical protein [Pirellulaceae bacterium]